LVYFLTMRSLICRALLTKFTAGQMPEKKVMLPVKGTARRPVCRAFPRRGGVAIFRLQNSMHLM